ncbi:hypothetical protein QE375_001777 [Microbacterium foliorum]|uniref:Uncharacterized protein n=1 Tax=Microbacterium foliorum TaxID=104336 RepID=A0ABU1HRG0_9MICO|nr:hypothetical protein [Microbacterium foliorum]
MPSDLDIGTGDVDRVTDGDLVRARVGGVDEGDERTRIIAVESAAVADLDRGEWTHRRHGRIDAEHRERLDAEGAATAAALGRCVALGGSGAFSGSVLRSEAAAGQLTREGRVREAERSGCRRHAVRRRHRVEHGGVESSAHEVRHQGRLTQRRRVAFGGSVLRSEVEALTTALPRLSRGPGDCEVGSDAVDRLQCLGLRIAHSRGERVDDDDQGDRDGEPDRDDHRLFLAARQLAPQICPVHVSPSAAPFAGR